MTLRYDGTWGAEWDENPRRLYTILGGPAHLASFLVHPDEPPRKRALEMAATFGACPRCGSRMREVEGVRECQRPKCGWRIAPRRGAA